MLSYTPDNTVLLFDSYKYSHPRQIRPGTDFVHCYIESRGGRWNGTLFFGLQMFLQRYLAKPITRRDVDEAEELLTAHGEPFDRALWDMVVDEYQGMLPLVIQAVPEGTWVPTGNVLVTIRNTDRRFAWLPGTIETALLRGVWYPTTVATSSLEAKATILASLNRTSDNPEGQIPFKLHDFGARGVSSHESAEIGGVAHLVNFRGTDTVEALLMARRCYGVDYAGFSIPAAEHLTITSWGRNYETAAYRNLLQQFGKPGKIFAAVCDSYDLEYAVREIWGKFLKDELLASGATVVIRPDSGDPLTIPIQTVKWLAEAFGTTKNSKGYAVLHPSVRVIQGDGITSDSLPKILANLEAEGFSADNLAFGMGGGLLQQVNRDTLRFAQKASAVERGDGVWHGICKDPKTDPGKRSKEGRLALLPGDAPHTFRTVQYDGAGDYGGGVLQRVYAPGWLPNPQTLAEIRERAEEAAHYLAASR